MISDYDQKQSGNNDDLARDDRHYVRVVTMNLSIAVGLGNATAVPSGEGNPISSF